MANGDLGDSDLWSDIWFTYDELLIMTKYLHNGYKLFKEIFKFEKNFSSLKKNITSYCMIKIK